MFNSAFILIGLITGAIEVVDDECVIFTDPRMQSRKYIRYFPMSAGAYKVTHYLN